MVVQKKVQTTLTHITIHTQYHTLKVRGGGRERQEGIKGDFIVDNVM